MLREQYPIDKVFEGIYSRFPSMDPVLAQIDVLLEDDELYQLVYADLSQRRPKTLQTGRPSTPLEVILRMLVLKRLYNWSYEETERGVSDSLGLRAFCRIYFEPVPDDTTLIRGANQIHAATLEQLNQRILTLAQAAGVTQGKKLRTDGTVVESNIHAPSDNQQLADSVRVLARTVDRAAQCLKPVNQAAQTLGQAMIRLAKQKSRQIGEVLRKGTQKGQQAGRQAYEELIQLTQQVVEQAQQSWVALQEVQGRQAQRLSQVFETFIPRAEQVIKQTQRRIFQGERVPATEKVVSIFEPHTDIIKRNKANKPVEYGHKVWFDEVDGGLISRYCILEGNPADTDQWLPSLEAHQQHFGHPPEQASADRGVFSLLNEQLAKDRGVGKVILPQPGTRTEERWHYEHQDWFVEGRKWHAGVEGRISVLKRVYGLDRCLNHGLEGFKTWVGWGVIAANLVKIGRTARNKKKGGS